MGHPKETKNENYYASVLNANSEDYMTIEGFIDSPIKKTLTWIIVILTLGLLRLYFYWKPSLMLKFTHRRCKLESAKKILLTDKYKQIFIEECKTIEDISFHDACNNNSTIIEKGDENEPFISVKSFRYFVNKRIKYYWNFQKSQFEPLLGLESQDVSLTSIRNLSPLGLSPAEAHYRFVIYGPNSIRVDLTPLFTLFVREVLSPFYVFQLFSIALWIVEYYLYYAVCIFVISATSIIYSLYSIRKNERALRNMIDNSNKVRVYRGTENGHKCTPVVIDSENLVPGDLIEIEQGQTMQCDVIILNGNVIVNESMLTGESIPITKVGIGLGNESNDEKLSMKRHKKNMLFAGTSVIQTRYYTHESVKAVVLRTGFRTSKGELVRAILHPKPAEFRFNTDLYKYILALALIALGGMIFTIVYKIHRKESFQEILIKSLDLVSIVIPPALPGALTACLIYAQARLKNQNIYCISPSAINVSGSVSIFVFDKTGTLTEDDCSLKCILPSEGGKFEENEIDNVDNLNNKYPRLIEALATCHSITHINNRLDGDPLDLKLFEFTKWDLIEPKEDEISNYDCMMPTIVRPQDTKLAGGTELGILKQFPFLSGLQRMSVVVRSLDRVNYEYFCKGSPEIVLTMCRDNSVPHNFNSILNKYTRKGYRVLGLAYKELDSSFTIVKIDKTPRETFECDLIFLGLVIMENKLKRETSPVIRILNRSNIRTIMCTGDNLLTGISVARECDMVLHSDEKAETKIVIIDAENSFNETPKFIISDINSDIQISHFRLLRSNYSLADKKEAELKYQYAINGNSFEIVRKCYPDLFVDLMKNGSIYARMSPEQKQQLIEGLQGQNYFVGMCGDGANDCEALKSSNAGISLSNAEASIASPFTSKTPNISCVPNLMLEGRATLIASFGLVKFICMYSLTQFVSVIILYTLGRNLADMQFLYIDLALITFMAFFFSRNPPFRTLHFKSPSAKLISWRPIVSLIFHIVLITFIQLFAFILVCNQPWFESSIHYEASAIFIVSSFQYVTEAVVFSASLPYRKSIFSNKLFTAYIFASYLFNIIISTQKFNWFNELLTLKRFPDWKFNLVLVLVATVHFVVAFLFETFLIDKEFSILFKKRKTW